MTSTFKVPFPAIRWIGLSAYGLMAILLIGNSCTLRRKDNTVRPLSAQEQQMFFSRAQDERRFWLTRYETDHGPVFSGAHRVHAERFARADFTDARRSSVPIIKVRLRSGEEYDALIDTSSPVNWIQFGPATREGVIPIGPPPHRMFPVHVNDPIPGFLSVASRLRIDMVNVETTLLYVKAAHGPMEQLNRHASSTSADIVLGSEFIRSFFFVQLNFAARMAVFATTTAYTPDPERLIASVPMQDYFGIIAVEGFLNGEETPFLLDTVGDFALASEWGGAPARQLMIGDLVLLNLDQTSTEEAGLGLPEIPRIGRRILERFVVTFDGDRRLVHFERPTI